VEKRVIPSYLLDRDELSVAPSKGEPRHPPSVCRREGLFKRESLFLTLKTGKAAKRRRAHDILLR